MLFASLAALTTRNSMLSIVVPLVLLNLGRGLCASSRLCVFSNCVKRKTKLREDEKLFDANERHVQDNRATFLKQWDQRVNKVENNNRHQSGGKIGPEPHPH